MTVWVKQVVVQAVEMFQLLLSPPIASKRVGLQLKGVTAEELKKKQEEGYCLFVKKKCP